jgi:DNA repair photolyase
MTECEFAYDSWCRNNGVEPLTPIEHFVDVANWAGIMNVVTRQERIDMPLVKSKGNMYQGWVTHMHTHLGGACSHACSYCYIKAMSQRFPGMKDRYSGPVRLIAEELEVPYGSGKSILIEHCNDLFAESVPDQMIIAILQHCRKYSKNIYVFQTKNPARYINKTFDKYWPEKMIRGCTIESNIHYPEISNAPEPWDRALAMGDLEGDTFITIEPILEFDLEDFTSLLQVAVPTFINIGADSKGTSLPEPNADKIEQLIRNVDGYYGIEIRKKVNLERLLK